MPDTKGQQPPAAPAEDPDADFTAVTIRFIDEVLHDLALKEGRASALARRLIRAHQDGVPLSAADDASGKILVRAIGAGYDRASETDSFREVGGDMEFSFDVPPELQDEKAVVEPVPDWVNETPDLLHPYQLICWSDGRAEQQEIDLTREEFIQLKAHLAKIRGYALPDKG